MTDGAAGGPPEADADAQLDAEKLDVLRAWGVGLGGDAREEVRAAGKAIVLLIEEIDRLYVQLWHARDGERANAAPPVDNLDRALTARIRAAIGRTRPPRRGRERESPDLPQGPA